MPNDFMPIMNDSQKIKINELSYVISEEQQDNEVSSFIVSVNSKAINETTEEVFYKQTDTKLSLIKEDEEWKINDFEVIK